MADLERFAAACATKGITNRERFAAHTGRRLSDLTLAKALQTVTGEAPAADPHFPPRFGPALYHPPAPLTSDEQAAWRERWIAKALPPLKGTPE